MIATEGLPSTFTHGLQYGADGAVQFRLWAPRSESVRLVLFNGDAIEQEQSMEQSDRGMFITKTDKLIEGQRYGFRLGTGPVLPDPATRWQPDGVHFPSAVWFPDGDAWNDDQWAGIPRSDLVIYELHVGTFTESGTFDAIHPRLAELRELGVNAIELMPIAQFPGNRNWGYDGVHPFAVQNTYGGPHGLQRLVDTCHREGFAVILDVVYNHLGPEGNYLNEFGPYFTDRYHTPWGAAFNYDQPGCEGCRAFVLDNVRYWVGELHVDGLRLDAVHAIFDSSPQHILREIKDAADAAAAERGWPVYVFAESDANDVRLIEANEPGLGLDAVWSDDFHHSVHSLLTNERHSYYMDFGDPEHLAKAFNQTFVYDGCQSRHRQRVRGTNAGHHSGDRFVVCIQNHDQIGNRDRGDRLGSLLNPAQQRLAAGLLLVAPHIPLLFMGEEYGETRPFPYFCSFLDSNLVEAIRRGRRAEHSAADSHGGEIDPQSEATFKSAKLSWSWPPDSLSAGLRRLYRDLIHSRTRWLAFRDFNTRHAELLPSPNAPHILRFVRGATSHTANGAMVAFFNLTDQEQYLEPSGHYDTALLMSSESHRYRGTRDPAQLVNSLLPYEFQIYGPNSWKSP